MTTGQSAMSAKRLSTIQGKQNLDHRGRSNDDCPLIIKLQQEIKSMRKTKDYIKEHGRYFEAEAKVSMREGFNKAFVTHKTMDFDTEPTVAEAITKIEKEYPHLKVERIDWIRDMSHKANELDEYYSKR